MTEDQPELDPAEDARVRALLADLGSSPGRDLPPEVAGRLDDKLAELVDERDEQMSARKAPASSAAHPAPVLPLRRRWARLTTIAAAAAIMVGAGTVTLERFVLGPGQTSDSVTAGDAGGDAVEDGAEAPLPLPESPGDSAAPGERGVTGLASELPVVRAGSFASDVTRLLRAGDARLLTPADPAPRNPPSPSAGQPPGEIATGDACPGPELLRGAVSTPVRYDGALAALVVHPVEDGLRLVEAWTCSGATRLATATVRRGD